MDEKRTREIDAAWRKSRREQFFADLKAKPAWLALLAGVIALLVFFYFVTSAPPSLVETLQGRVVGEFVTPSKYFAPHWQITVQLEGGGTVSLQMPRNEILRTDTPMKVAHMRRVIGPLTQDLYVFAGYEETSK